MKGKVINVNSTIIFHCERGLMCCLICTGKNKCTHYSIKNEHQSCDTCQYKSNGLSSECFNCQGLNYKQKQ